MSETSILDKLKDLVRVLNSSTIDAEKLVFKGNHKAGIRVRKNMQQMRRIAKEIRDLVQQSQKKN